MLFVSCGDWWPKNHAINAPVEQPMNLLKHVLVRCLAPPGTVAVMSRPQRNRHVISFRQPIVNPVKHFRPVEIQGWRHDANRSCLSGLHSTYEKIGAISQ